MTKEQFYEINQRLEKWRRQRHLTKEKQRLGYLGNTYEEVSEYYRAKDEYEKIDAIMDITVFTLNSFFLFSLRILFLYFASSFSAHDNSLRILFVSI